MGFASPMLALGADAFQVVVPLKPQGVKDDRQMHGGVCKPACLEAICNATKSVLLSETQTDHGNVLEREGLRHKWQV